MEVGPDFLGGSYKGYSTVVNPTRSVNMFTVLDNKGGKPISAQGTPGLKQFCRSTEVAQDLTSGYSETDTGNKFSETASTLTVTALALTDTAILAKDFTASYFSANVTVKFTVNVSAGSSPGRVEAVVFTNQAAETITGHNTNSHDYLSAEIIIGTTGFALYIRERNGATETYDDATYEGDTVFFSLSTNYYCTMIRDEAVGTYGTLYLHVYSDSARTVLLGSATLALTEKENFQYFYAGCSIGGAAGAQTVTCTVADYKIAISDTVVRGISRKVGDYIYAVIGSDIMRVSSAGAMVDKGNLDTATGPVYFVDNGVKILFVDGTSGYTIVSDTFAKITDAQFPATPSSCAYQDGYFIVTKASTDEYYISAADDPTAWGGEYASAEGLADSLMRCHSTGKDLWLLGANSYEVAYNSGDADFPFKRIEGSRSTIGCGAAASMSEVQGTLFWFTDHRRVVMTVGYNAAPISTPQIEYLWGNYTSVSDAIGMAFVFEGHAWYVLVFPTESKTWVYDAMTDLWFELESTEGYRWRGNCHVYAFDKHLVGDYALSIIHELDSDCYTDNGLAIKRIRDSAYVDGKGTTLFFGGLEIIGETGVGNAASPSTDPQIYLSWSDDGGRSYCTPLGTDWGTYQDYDARAVFRRLGKSGRRTWRVTYEEQTKFVLTGAQYSPVPRTGE